jgi:hypothetical protein
MLQLRKIYLTFGISIHGRRRFHQKNTNFAASMRRAATFLQKWQSFLRRKGVNALSRFPIENRVPPEDHDQCRAFISSRPEGNGGPRGAFMAILQVMHTPWRRQSILP